MRSLLTVVLALGALAPGTAPAAVFTVDNLGDSTDADPGDGTCATSLGWCTLRAAVAEANALGGVHTVQLPAGTFSLGGALSVETASLDLTIAGAGEALTILSGGDLHPVLEIAPASTVRVYDATLRDGYAINPGGCVGNDGWLELHRVKVAGCESEDGGGGIRSSGDLVLRDVTVAGNRAPFGAGGGLQVFGTAVLDRVWIVANLAHGGGGIYHDGLVVIGDSTIEYNEATSYGGGVYLSDGTTTVIERSLVRGNTTDADGAGMWTRGSTLLRNVTLTGNVADGYGGAIGGWTDGDLRLVNVTISGNQGVLGAGAIYGHGGMIAASAANTIFGANGASPCNAQPTSLGYNLMIVASLGCLTATTGDLGYADLLLGNLQDNGGATETMALLPGSPAIDAGYDGFGPGHDQRGFSRPVDAGSGGGVDIGAFEYGGVSALIFADGFESGGTHRW